jgi:hypothetical protein
MTEAVDRISESLARLAGLSAGYLPVFLSIIVTGGATEDASSLRTSPPALLALTIIQL